MENNNASKKFEQTGLTLPPAPKPLGVYKPYLIDGNHLYVSGHGPFKTDGTLIIGQIGLDMDIEEGKVAAQQVSLSILSTIVTPSFSSSSTSASRFSTR